MNTVTRFFRIGVLLVILSIFSSCATTSQNPSAKERKDALVQLRKLKEKCETVISDPARAEKVMSSLDEMKSLFVLSNQELKNHRAQMVALLGEYETTSGALQQQLDTFNENRKKRIEQLTLVSQTIRDSTTEEEWKDLQKGVKKTIKSFLKFAQTP